jgi:hypothetical protein
MSRPTAFQWFGYCHFLPYGMRMQHAGEVAPLCPIPELALDADNATKHGRLWNRIKSRVRGVG